MNPIPTTKAMNPAPGKGVSSFPTPVIKDTVIVEVVNAWKGDYQPLEYGTKWDDVPHASVQGSFPDHKLINQAPNSEDGQWVKRIWANDRVDQDTYNYAIKYSGGSDAHPIYIRAYVELRETYAPVPDLSPDPLFPNAKLVEEEVQRDESELDSRYVKVIRTYETLPGPIISSQRINERGDLETVNVQTVDPNTPPDPDGLFVTQSQVIKEDVSKGTKTTATVPSHSTLLIKEKKEGLLGESVTTEDIVDPSAEPSELSQTIVSSVVQQVSATKAIKRTTFSNEPSSLSGKSKDGKLLGDVTITESIVQGDANPDNPSGVTNGTLSSEVKQVSRNRAIKRTVTLNSTPTLRGSESKGGLLGNTTTQETVVPAGTQATQPTINVISSAVEPIDKTRSRQIVVTSSGPTSLSGKQNKGGLLGKTTVTERIVPYNSDPDELSESVLSSEVTPIDAAKAKKTTITSEGPKTLTGNQNKEGLLGKTVVKEEIVASGSPPDPLSLTVLSSEVTPIDETKSKKTTVESVGPNILLTTGLYDSPVGLIRGTGGKEIVAAGAEIENADLYLLSAKTTQIDEAKALYEYTSADGYPTLYGVDYDDAIGAPVRYTRTIVPPTDITNSSNWEQNANTEIEPIDQWKSLRKKYDVASIREAYLAQYYAIETQVNVTLPDKLLSATIYWSKDNGKGGEVRTSPTVGGDSYSYTESYSHNSTANVTGDIYFKVEKGFSGSLPGTQHIFFLPIVDGKVNVPILESLNEKAGATFEKWPNIKRRTENIVIVSGSKQQSKSFTKGESVSINGYAKNDREDESFSIDRNANSVVVPDTIHESITIVPVEVGDFGDVPPPEYAIYPEELEATSISKFPVGEYLIDGKMDLYKYGLVKVTAITVKITENYT